jgi:hypothetical protein
MAVGLCCMALAFVGPSRQADPLLFGADAWSEPIPMIPAMPGLFTIATMISPTDRHSMEIDLMPCLELAEHSLLGLGVHTVNEEWARAGANSNCSASSRLRLDRPLRFPHAEAETVAAAAPDARLQIPEAQLPMVAGFREELPPEHRSALALVKRTQEWLSVSRRVVIGGPNKWPLRYLLFVISWGLILAGTLTLLLALLGRLT